MPRLSAGCRECRRRKVKCDEGKPNCERCIKAKIGCPGYGRDPPRPRKLAFVDQTQRTAAKYQTLESKSILTVPRTNSTLSEWQHTGKRDGGGGEQGPSQRKQSSTYVPLDLQQHVVSNASIRDLSHYNVLRSQMFAKFVHMYCPCAQRDSYSLFCHYIELLPDACPDNQPLDSACTALSALQLGSSQEDQEMLMQGQQTYARSLKQLSLALSHQTSANNDETFGTIIVLGLCELFKTINHGEGGWIRHLDGGRQYLQKRGAKGINTALSQSLFVNIRHASMCEGLARRKRVVFDEPLWLEAAHNIAKDDMMIELIDIGVHIPTILEQVDRFHNDDSTILDAAEILEIIRLGQARLKRWLKKHASPKGAFRWELVDRGQIEDLGLLADDTTFQNLYSFPSFGSANAFALYTLFCTILARTYLQFSQTLLDHQIQPDLISEQSIIESEELLVEQIRASCRCCPFIARPGSAVAGHVVALLCTGYIRSILKELDLPEETAWIAKICQNIASKGLIEPMASYPAGQPYKMRMRSPFRPIEE